MSPSMSAQKITVRCKINGQDRSFTTYPMARLLDLLREDAGLTGTKEGCGEGECGACSVLVGGELVNSCLIPAIQAEGTEITTIEGIAEGEKLNFIQQAFLEYGGAQCGICTPGMVLAVVYLLNRIKKPEDLTEAALRTALAGNLCRCTGYTKIFESVVRACHARFGASAGASSGDQR
ncbi:MAG: (2Fe-2S)-binding protein [Oligoflexia bacterium]|nr:(2Fe-2S)-binding protein [Oligoflexia bacterium]